MVGEENLNYQNLSMKIIEYTNARNIVVEFEDGFVCNSNYGNFRSGKIKSKYFKSVCGVGFFGDGFYSSSIIKDNGFQNSYQYLCWRGMIKRCYDIKSQSKNTSYIGCTVCDEWHNFQNFAEWYNKNYYSVGNETMHLDKDILIKGNKVYSPKTCCFVPQYINTLFVKNTKMRGLYPVGVSKKKSSGRYSSSITKDDIRIHLGYFDTAEEAFLKYKEEKENYIKEVADRYKGLIPNYLYEAMYSYEIKITD